MESVISSLIGALSNSPNLAVIFVAIFSLVVGAFLFFRKTNLTEFASVSEMQMGQIGTLLKQVEALSSELEKAREQINKIHEQNIKLMEQLRESNKKIQALEKIIAKKAGNV